MKDEVVFEDSRLNVRSNLNNIDKSFTFDGMVNFKALVLGNKLFDIKVSDLNRGIEFGRIQALLSKVG